jgi:dihydrodiol dehydrogenase / D-xylose 1-dehydrogenase (NADP)
MTASTPPPPLDDPSVSNPLECPPLRWGLIGCGRVSHDFTQALKHLPTASVVACAARDEDRAKEFAAKHGIPTAYGNYDDLLKDKDVDIVYVGNVHAFRRSIGEKCILANKHVLLEKPFCCTAADAEYLIQLAKERNLFLMEGMWTRFFPAVEQARRLVCGAHGEAGVMGEVVAVFSDFNFNASDSEEYPTSFVYNRKLGGGASLLVAPYPISAASLFFGSAAPDSIKVVGQVDEATGVDLQACIALSFPPTGTVAPAVDSSNSNENTPKLPGSGVATLSYGMLGESEEETTVICTKGRLTIKSPGHCPTSLKVSLKGEGRGNAASEMSYEYPLPEDTDEIKKAGGFVYPNSAGFCYEAAAVARCIAAGKTEAPQFTLADTMITMQILDEARKQLGLKTVDED